MTADLILLLWVCGRPSSRYKADTGIAVLPGIYTFALPRDLCLVNQTSFTTRRVNYKNGYRTTLLAVSPQQQIAFWSQSLIKRQINIVKTHLTDTKGNE